MVYAISSLYNTLTVYNSCIIHLEFEDTLLYIDMHMYHFDSYDKEIQTFKLSQMYRQSLSSPFTKYCDHKGEEIRGIYNKRIPMNRTAKPFGMGTTVID